MPTQDQIRAMAQKACFYVDPEGMWLRIQFVDDDEKGFWAFDEDQEQEWFVDFSHITLGGQERFFQLMEMPVPTE